MTASIDATPTQPVAAKVGSRDIDRAAAEPFTDVEILRELEPLVGKRDRPPRARARDWMPHEYVPWDEGTQLRRACSAARRGTSSSRASPRRSAPRWS